MFLRAFLDFFVTKRSPFRERSVDLFAIFILKSQCSFLAFINLATELYTLIIAF